MGSGERSRWFVNKDVLAFAGMVTSEGMIVGGNTLYKSATAQGINSYVFTFYVFLIGFIFVLPFPFILQRRTSIPPIQFSIVVKLFLISVIMCVCYSKEVGKCKLCNGAWMYSIVFALASAHVHLCWCPCAQRYLSQICGYVGIKYSSPTLSSIMGNLSPAFTFVLAFIFRMEKINFRSYTSQAKVIGTIVSISGALIATLYNGPSLLSVSMGMNWIIGGILLITQYVLISFALVAQAKIMITYPVDLMVVFIFSLNGLLVAGLAAVVMARDFDAWKLKPNIVLAAILYMGFSSGFLSVVIQIWTLHLKGPVYVAMFKPLTILIAVIMGVLFLEDSLHLGSVVGGIIITIGFYGVLWGKAKEETAASTQTTTPLLEPQPHHALEQPSSSC